MFTEIAISSFKTVISKLPGWLIRFFYRPEKIAGSIDLELRHNNPIIISFGTEIPSIDLYFQIYNRSNFGLVLDRLLIDFWIGQRLFCGAVLRRGCVKPRERFDEVYFTQQLTLSQQEQIKRHKEGQLLSVPVSIMVTGYFESKVGVVCVEKRIDRADVPCK